MIQNFISKDIPDNIRNANILGFTLVELAIALMVIGLLIGGVLKGQELIENARVIQTVRQIKAYDTAAIIFRNTYNALPGDIKRPNRIPNCTDAICSIGGNGNGKIGVLGDPNRNIESFNFFTHLSKAGLLEKPVDGGTEAELNTHITTMSNNYESETRELFFPDIAIGGYILGFENIRNSSGYYYIFSSKHVATLDNKMDDGMPRTGIMIAEECYDGEEDGESLYQQNPDIEYCTGWIIPSFYSH